MSAPLDVERAAPARSGNGSLETDPLGSAIEYRDSLRQGSGQLVDAHGLSYREQVLDNWAPEAIRALGIRRLPEGGAK
jgi:hypothetical protein